MLSLLKNRIMRKILKYFGFYDNGKTTVTEKQCNINSVSKSFYCKDQSIHSFDKCKKVCDYCERFEN